MIYRDANEQSEAVKKLYKLKQTKLARQYTTKFQQYCQRTGQDEKAIKDQFYKNFRDEVKDKLSRIEELLDNLHEYMQRAIKINNRLYTRKQEKCYKDNFRPQYPLNTGQKREAEDLIDQE